MCIVLIDHEDDKYWVKMKPSELVDKVVKEGKLQDKSIGALTKWIAENQGKESISECLSAIADDEILQLTPEGKGKGKLFIKKLKYSNLFNGLAIRYSENGWFEEAEAVFERILKRTPNDIDSLHNYGAAMLNKTLAIYRQRKEMDKKQLEKARALIFKAFDFDKKAYEDWLTKPSYMNLCYLRALEAVYHFNVRESFTAFVLGWMSIEMTVRARWFKFIRERTTQGLNDLTKWDMEYIVETLFLSDASGSFRSIKNDLDTLKGTRNRLLHGEIDNPTLGQAKLCIDTALALQRPASIGA